jgi:hypothetical protein
MTSKTNKIVVHHFSDSVSEDVFRYKLCKYMFISTVVYLEYKSKIINYDLRLFSDGDNYFVANNKIDKYVICFLLNKQFSTVTTPENCKYKFNIIDQSANILELSEKDVLYLHEDNYEVIQVIGESLDYKEENDDEEKEESENSENSGSSKEYEIVDSKKENDNN